MSEDMQFQTKRLFMRPPEPRDIAEITERIGHPDVLRMLGRAPSPYQRKDARYWINKSETDRASGKEFAFVITLPASGVIGSVGFNRAVGQVWEVGYWLGKDWWGQGYITEAAQGLLDWGRRTHGITQFVSGHFTDNPASGAVLKKLGFQPVGEQAFFGQARGKKDPALRYVLGAPASAALRTNPH